MATQSSLAFPVETSNTDEQKTKQDHSQVWMEDYDIKIQIRAPQSKKLKEITNHEKVVEIVNTINTAYDVGASPRQHIKLGALKINKVEAIQVYLSKDKSTVYLHTEKGVKALTSKSFYQLFQPSIEAEPLPPGYEPKAFPPLPKGEGVHSEDIEHIN